MSHSLLVIVSWNFFFFKQKTAYEMRISDWSSDVCSSDLTTAVYQCPNYICEEKEHSNRHDRIAYRGNVIPICESCWIIRYASRHATHAQKMHGKEQHINASKEYPEMQFPQSLAVHPPTYLRKPVVESCKEREDRA